jgi:hypothetical protein
VLSTGDSEETERIAGAGALPSTLIEEGERLRIRVDLAAGSVGFIRRRCLTKPRSILEEKGF